MEEIQKYYTKKRYTNELDDINNFIKIYSDKKYDDIMKLKTDLIDKIKELDNAPNIVQNKSQNDLNSLFEKIDKKVQMQDWKRIPKYIQNEKIKDYVDSNSNYDNKNYYKKILERIRSGKIKCAHIKYNKDTCKIDEILNIS